MAAPNERARIAHLLRRAGFGAGEAELDEYAALGFEASVERLVHPEAVADPAWDRLGAGPAEPGKLADYQQLWLALMVGTRRPLLEKLTLFWHGHFATADSKVKSPPLMWRQNGLFRDRALGRFGELAGAVSRDPAMLIWLDGNQNRKAAPNENYGRELLELFTLGIGNYTEADVAAAARAFTGWFFRAERNEDNKIVGGEFAFNARQHDGGVKTFLGRTGNWGGDEILGIVLEQPACARFIARKLFAFFVWDGPDEATVAPFAGLLLRSGYDIRAAVRALLLSPEFSSERAYRARIKGPIEFVVGTLRALGMETPPKETVATLRKMGQEPLNPPHVGGWPGGPAWINPSGLLERYNFVNRVVTARGGGAAFDPAPLFAGRNLDTPERLVDRVAGLLLDGAIADRDRAALVDYLRRDDKGQPGNFTLNARTIDGKARGLIHLVASLPAYQLG